MSFFAAGILLGVLHLLPESVDLSGVSMVILCLLMALVGFSVGNNPDSLNNIKTLDRKVLLLPLMTVLGTFLGCTLAWDFQTCLQSEAASGTIPCPAY